MGSNLNALYKLLVENRKHEDDIGGWHHNHKHFHLEVDQIYKRIENGESLSKGKDKGFLKELHS